MPLPLRYRVHAHLETGQPPVGTVAVAFSPAGTLLATSSLDNIVRIWRVEDTALLHVYSGSSVAMSLLWPSGKEDIIVCGLEDGSIISLALTESSLEAVGFWAHAYPVECLSAKGSYLASGAHEELFIWKLREGKWTPHQDLGKPPTTSHNKTREIIVTSIHWTRTTSNSSVLLVTYLHHGFMVFNTRDWSTVRAFPLTGCIADASVTADGKTIVISNMTTGFDLYDVESVTSLGSYQHDVGALRLVPVTFIHGGNAVLSGSTTGEVHLWDMKTCCMIHTLPLQQHEQVLAVDAHYDRRNDWFFIVTGIYNPATDSSVVVWKTERLGNDTHTPPRQVIKQPTTGAAWVIATALGLLAWIVILIGFTMFT